MATSLTLTYGFYNSAYDPTTQEYDREYDAEDFSRIFDGVITDGVYAGIGDQFMVSLASGFTLQIGTGRAWFEHTWSYNTAPDVSITLNNPHPTSDRVDAVVLKIDAANRKNEFSVIQGTIFNPTDYPSGASLDPVKPQLRNNSSHPEYNHCYPLAYVRVRTGTSAILDTDIENAVGVATYVDTDGTVKPLCPWVTSILTSYNASGLVAQWSAAVLHEIDNLENVIGNVTGQTSADIRPIIGYNVVVPVSAWHTYTPAVGSEEENISSIGYIYRAFMTSDGLADVTQGMRPYVTWSLRSIEEAGADLLNQYQCGTESINNVDTGGVYVYATSIPKDAILALTVECRSVISADIVYAYLVVTHPDGSSVTCLSNGVVAWNKEISLSTTKTMFYLKDNTTSCDVTATSGGSSATATVSISVGGGAWYHTTLVFPEEP